MSTLTSLLAGIVADPLEETRWLVLADWLEEFDDPRRAELLRLHRKMLATCCEPDRHPDRAEWQARMVALLVGGVRPCVPQETLVLPGGAEMTFSFIPPGRFLMGSNHPKGDEYDQPVHEVTMARGFYLGTSPVTQAQWVAIMETNPSHFQGPNRPVEDALLGDCQEFVGRLNAHLNGRGGVRLPAEAEWEYACRSGTTTEYHFGDQISPDLANYDGNETWNGSPKGISRDETTEVGMFPANAWGLFDVHGNVYEWCPDLWDEAFYEKTPFEDSIGRDAQARLYVMRGGCWASDPIFCRAAARDGFEEWFRHFGVGFRLAFHRG